MHTQFKAGSCSETAINQMQGHFNFDILLFSVLWKSLPPPKDRKASAEPQKHLYGMTLIGYTHPSPLLAQPSCDIVNVFLLTSGYYVRDYWAMFVPALTCLYWCISSHDELYRHIKTPPLMVMHADFLTWIQGQLIIKVAAMWCYINFPPARYHLPDII